MRRGARAKLRVTEGAPSVRLLAAGGLQHGLCESRADGSARAKQTGSDESAGFFGGA